MARVYLKNQGVSPRIEIGDVETEAMLLEIGLPAIKDIRQALIAFGNGLVKNKFIELKKSGGLTYSDIIIGNF